MHDSERNALMYILHIFLLAAVLRAVAQFRDLIAGGQIREHTFFDKSILVVTDTWRPVTTRKFRKISPRAATAAAPRSRPGRSPGF